MHIHIYINIYISIYNASHQSSSATCGRPNATYAE